MLGRLVIDGFHALLGKGTCVLDFLSAFAVRPAVKHASGSELLLECRIFRIVRSPPALLPHLGDKGCQRTRQTRAWSAEICPCPRDGSCRTGRWHSPSGFSNSAIVGSSAEMPTSAPGIPTFVKPVRIGFWPVINAARPAVQLCWP